MPDERQNLKDEDKKQEGGEKSPKKFPAWLKWFLIVVSIAISSLGAFSLTRYVIWPKYQKFQVEKKLSKKPNKDVQKSYEMGMVHIIDELTVNTLGSNGRRFVVAEYALESKDKKVLQEIKAREPQLRDEFIKYLRLKTANQILDPTFQEKSRSELIAITNKRLNRGTIDSLYYIKLIIQ